MNDPQLPKPFRGIRAELRVSAPLRWAAQLIISLGLLALVFRSVDLAIFWQTVVASNGLLVAISAVCFAPAQLLGAYRWHFLLRGVGLALPFGAVLRNNLLGQLSAIYLPGQVSGDVVRVVAIANERGQLGAFALSAVVDKIALLAAIAALALVGTLGSPELIRLPGLATASLALMVAALVALALISQPRLIGALVAWLALRRRLPDRLAARLDILLGRDRIHWPVLVGSLLLGLLLIIFNGLGAFALLRGMHIPIRFIDWLAIYSIVSVIQVIPVSIGGLGVREGALSAMFLLYGVTPTAATSFSLIGFVCSALLLWLSWALSALLLKEAPRHDQPRPNQPPDGIAV